ncbi:hypothetical protein AGR1_03875 [Agrobacterium sp. B1(2019)]|nr:hypothetical protein AGR1_03875 [Agrobacterium sp. B1(2019)]
MGRLTETEKWTNEETQKLIDLAKAGHTASEICKELGRTYGAIATKATRIKLQYRNAKSPPDFDPSKQKDMPCMTCRSPMISEWIGNRICEECKDSNAFREIASSAVGGSTGGRRTPVSGAP